MQGHELANVANEGAIECGRRGGSLITNLDIYNGIDRILQVLHPLILPCVETAFHMCACSVEGQKHILMP